MAQGILVFVEQRNGQVRKSSLEALSEARRISINTKEPVTAVIVGSNIKQLAEELPRYGAAKVLVIDDAAFANYSTEGYAQALTEAVKKVDPKYVFAAHTAMAKDLIPRVVARLDGAMASDVIELKDEGGKLLATRAVYSAKSYAVFEPNADITFYTLRPNAFAISDPNGANGTAIETLAVQPGEIRAKVVETHAAEGQKVELSEARIVVSGGRGIKGPENWNILQELCDSMGAALGASRAVVDAGWIEHGHQVGQTGKTVSPQLYFACGISGAIQHLAGMNSSKVIVAINKDPEAPIFKHATYGIVGDMFEIVPKLSAEMRKAMAHN